MEVNLAVAGVIIVYKYKWKVHGGWLAGWAGIYPRWHGGGGGGSIMYDQVNGLV